MNTTTTAEKLATLNAFRELEGKAPFADWRNARHQPILDAYRAAANDAALLEEDLSDEPDALIVTKNGEMVRESELTTEEAAKVTGAPKPPAYKVLARQSGPKSTIEKPVDVVHGFLNENPEMKRKEAIAALVGMGVNYSTARTQYQKWFSARKG